MRLKIQTKSPGFRNSAEIKSYAHCKVLPAPSSLRPFGFIVFMESLCREQHVELAELLQHGGGGVRQLVAATQDGGDGDDGDANTCDVIVLGCGVCLKEEVETQELVTSVKILIIQVGSS